MADFSRRLKALQPLVDRLTTRQRAAEVEAARKRLEGADVFSKRMELLRDGLSVSEAIERVPAITYPGIERDREIMRAYYAQWYPEGYDAGAELRRRLDAIRENRRQAVLTMSETAVIPIDDAPANTGDDNGEA